MITAKEIHKYIIQSYIAFYMHNEKMNATSIKMYFIALHYIDRGDYYG